MFVGPSQTSLSQWYTTPLGAHLLAAEQAYFDRELADVFGFNAFQLGLPEFEFLRANRMPLRCVAAGEGPVAMRADLRALPIQTASADLVVLPHVLEFSANPHQVLREVSRILMPEGHIVLSGFNPWSLWGLRRMGTWGKGRQMYPWRGEFIHLPRIKDWMALLGIELVGGRMCAYAPPIMNHKWFQRFSFMESAGDRWWPFAGGVYFLHGVKRVQGLRIILPKWRAAEARRKALAAVPQKTGASDDALAARSNLDNQA